MRCGCARSRHVQVVSSRLLWHVMAIIFLGTPSSTAGSLSGSIMTEQFEPLSGVPVKLLPHNKNVPQQYTVTNGAGVFTFVELMAGEYAVRVDYYPFISHVVERIHIGQAEDCLLRRILLEPGEGAGNCVNRVAPVSDVRHMMEQDIQVTGRIGIGNGERAFVTLVVFMEDTIQSHSMLTDNRGIFRFVSPAGGDVRLKIEIRDRFGRTIIPEQQADLGLARLGDKIVVHTINVDKAARGHVCY